jgi:hypothetical protein
MLLNVPCHVFHNLRNDNSFADTMYSHVACDTMAATVSLKSIEKLVFVNETPSVVCEVRSMQYLHFLIFGHNLVIN